MDEMMEQLLEGLRSFNEYFDFGCRGICGECKLQKVLYYDADYGSDVDICDALLKMCEKFDIR